MRKHEHPRKERVEGLRKMKQLAHLYTKFEIDLILLEYKRHREDNAYIRL